MEKKYVETVSGINVSNGVVKIFFISEDESNQTNVFKAEESKNDAKKADQSSDRKILMKHDHTTIMPISGFMYMVSVIKNLLEHPEMQEQLEKYIEAGLLPKVNPQDEDEDEEILFEEARD